MVDDIQSNERPGRHRRRSDRDCFEVILVRLVTGCSWQDAENHCTKKISDTTARSRRDEWIKAGVSKAIVNEAISAYDKVTGLFSYPHGLLLRLAISPVEMRLAGSRRLFVDPP